MNAKVDFGEARQNARNGVKRTSAVASPEVRNGEGFRMPAMPVVPGAGAGVRKPPRKEPAGWRVRFRRYGDLTVLLGRQWLHGCG
jgi:hypothetical protein